jgi:hypothetical protein
VLPVCQRAPRPLIAGAPDDETRERILKLVADLQQSLREIDE